ncbi:hypothetical protein Egran_02763 [Elaphomyces granulatus]|uniref:PEX11 domain protein n=1 Tax=Elaphomyces granulatus TaxID=519963 RepID=A0A232LZE5_9EURO|nr:hypothetical protein Egran_02763 [Elaphomyces granulatus]
MTTPIATRGGHRLSFLKQLTNFTNTNAGIEKILRLLQALAQIFASLAIESSPIALQSSIARTQLATGRRYLRFFKFIEHFDRAFTLLAPPLNASGAGSTATTNKSVIFTSIEFGKWSCLGLYFLLEDLTIMDAMGIWGTTWGRDILIEANRFWFYSLILSLCCSLWTLSPRSNISNRRSSSDHSTTEKTQQPDEKEKQPSSAPVVKQIVVDSFDLLIPGAFVGWIAASPVQVGLATIISTVVTSRDIWIQAQPAA